MLISHDIGTLDIAHLLGCLLILPLHYIAFDDVVMQCRRAKPSHGRIHIFVIKTAF